MKKHLVFIYKHISNVTLNTLKLSVLSWKKNYDYNKIFICGDFDNKTENILKETKLFNEIINIKIPFSYYGHKNDKINFQTLSAWNFLKEPFIVCRNDIFPFKKVSEKYINKEYNILYEDYSKSEKFWWTDRYINMLEYFNSKFDRNFKTIYEGHQFFDIDEEFISFIKENKDLMFIQTFGNIKTFYHLLKNENIFEPKYLQTTFFGGKWKFEEDERTIGINLTIPTNSKSKNLIEKKLNLKLNDDLSIK